VLSTTAAGVGAGLWLSKKDKAASGEFPVRILGPNSTAGHRLRDGFKFPEPQQSSEVDVLIVGGGMAGLSAAWRLQKKGQNNFKIIELEDSVGGNSRSGKNEISKFPWGAHYVTLLNEEAEAARELFEDFGIITGYKDGQALYNDYFLCQAPHEKLFIYQKWQEGVVPKIGNSTNDDNQIKAFFEFVEEMRFKKGKDARFAFSIPMAMSSSDPKFLVLDAVSMKDYMQSQGWDSAALNWYVNYCCRDDFGTPHDKTSAWAGLHYFCSRRTRADGVDGSSVLTWPEGNGWLVDRMHERLANFIQTGSMAIRLEAKPDQVVVDTWSEAEQQVQRWKAKSVILAIPRFVSAHLSPDLAMSQGPIVKELEYAPWMVANISLKQNPKLTSRAWDNVLFKSESLGYVDATHQSVQQQQSSTVWTYYYPLDQKPAPEARREALQRSPGFWKELIVSDLQSAYPEIADDILGIDVWLWGHAMIRPKPGFMWGPAREQMQKSQGRLHFAHSDMSGFSIFEEAHYHGVRAADEVLKNG